MQLQFEKQGIPYLQTVKREVQTREQTQEIRISDGMPDIGNIIGAWGQVILRGKEWQADGMTVNGGTMVWVLYLPEDGTIPYCVESWIPFQMRWSFPPTQHDGVILAQCCLKSVDARSTSARKMMLRTNVSVLGWAVENGGCEIFSPTEVVPEDVQLQQVSYPMQIPIEAGEKVFSLEETLSLPPSMPKMETLLSYNLQPEITEEKMMADKVVFRGNAVLHMLYLAEDGGVYSWDFDLPFTQYSELDREYGEDAEVMLLPCVTALELEREAENINMKAGLVCQYRISHRPLIRIVTDAYSPRRSVEPVLQELQLPGILESKTQIIHGQTTVPADSMRLTDVQFCVQPVHSHTDAQVATLEIPGTFQILHYDMEGIPNAVVHKWEQNVTLPVGEGTTVEAVALPSGKPQGALMSGSAQLSNDIKLISESVNTTPVTIIAGLELGELQEPDLYRPSLILRRSGGKTLWELAKDSGSTVDAIRDANHLQSEPDAQQMLLIPVV